MGRLRGALGPRAAGPLSGVHATAGSSCRPGRDAYVEASRPLVEAMRDDGLPADAAVQACRLLMWATVGFGAVESGAEPPPRARRPARPGGDPGGVDAAEVDTLFDLHIRYLIEGIARDADAERARDPRTTTERATDR